MASTVRTNPTAVALGVLQSTFAQNNMFVTRYTPNGTPDWIATLGGASTIGPSTIIGNATILGNFGSILTYTIRTVLDSQNNTYIIGMYNSNSLTMYNNTASVISGISSPRTFTNVFLAKFSADGTTGALARLGSVSTVNSGGTSNFRIAIDSSNNLYMVGNNSSRYFGFYPSSNPLEPSLNIDNPNTSTSFPTGYIAKVDSGLTTIQIGRIQGPSSSSPMTFLPSFITYDSLQNPIATYVIATGTTSSFQVYCMGNYTSNPDYIINNSINQSTNQSQISFLSRFTESPTTSWTAIQGGISTITINSAVFFANPNRAQFGGTIFVDSNDRIYTTLYSSTLTTLPSIMNVFDKTGSTVISPQRIAGSSVIASTCAISMSYPIDGINRPQ
jgi:hypothetical protein